MILWYTLSTQFFVQRICTSLVAVRAGSVMCAVAGLLRMTSAGCSRAMTSWRNMNDLESSMAHFGIPIEACTRRSYDLVGLGHFLSNSCPLQRKQRRSKGPRQPWLHRWACVHIRRQLSGSVRSMSDISVMGIILIIHALSIPHLTQTKQDILSSHPSHQLWQIVCVYSFACAWNDPILPSEVPRWMRCQWSPGASEMWHKVRTMKRAKSAKNAWWPGITPSSTQTQNYAELYSSKRLKWLTKNMEKSWKIRYPKKFGTSESLLSHVSCHSFCLGAEAEIVNLEMSNVDLWAFPWRRCDGFDTSVLSSCRT